MRRLLGLSIASHVSVCRDHPYSDLAQCPVPQSFIPDHLEDAVCLWYIESVANTLLVEDHPKNQH